MCLTRNASKSRWDSSDVKKARGGGSKNACQTDHRSPQQCAPRGTPLAFSVDTSSFPHTKLKVSSLKGNTGHAPRAVTEMSTSAKPRHPSFSHDSGTFHTTGPIFVELAPPVESRTNDSPGQWNGRRSWCVGSGNGKADITVEQALPKRHQGQRKRADTERGLVQIWKSMGNIVKWCFPSTLDGLTRRSRWASGMIGWCAFVGFCTVVELTCYPDARSKAKRKLCVYSNGIGSHVSAIGLVVKYLVAIEMPRVRFPDGANVFHVCFLFYYPDTVRGSIHCLSVSSGAFASLCI